MEKSPLTETARSSEPKGRSRPLQRVKSRTEPALTVLSPVMRGVSPSCASPSAVRRAEGEERDRVNGTDPVGSEKVREDRGLFEDNRLVPPLGGTGHGQGLGRVGPADDDVELVEIGVLQVRPS